MTSSGLIHGIGTSVPPQKRNRVETVTSRPRRAAARVGRRIAGSCRGAACSADHQDVQALPARPSEPTGRTARVRDNGSTAVGPRARIPCAEMRLGVPKETAPGERRVALVPEAAGRLAGAGFEVVVERGAGAAAAFPDEAFAEAGATLVDNAFDADAVAKVQRPSGGEVEALRDGSVLVAFLQPLTDPEGIERRLGAVVTGFDVRPVVREQVESLGASFLDLGVTVEEAEGGYARELSEEDRRRQQEALEGRIAEFDVVVTTALVPGRPAPRLIPAAAVRGMRPGSVVVDVAAEAGGNCELTEAGEVVEGGGVTIVGLTNLPSTMPYHASQLYSRNVAALLQHLAPEGEPVLDFEDEITAGACVTRKTEVAA